MIDRSVSKDTSNHLDRLIQVGREAVRGAQEESRRPGVSNVYSLDGKSFHELPSGELSLTPPDGSKTA